VQVFQKTIYPLRYYEFNLQSGTLSYFDKPGGNLKKAIRSKDLVSCSLGSTKNDDKAGVQSGTSDFPFIFLLVTTSRTFYLFAATEEE
jgi:hypothetical protein